MLLSTACAACSRPGPSPCPACAATLVRPAPIPPPPGIDIVLAALAYEGAAREVIAQLKYRNRRSPVAWLAAAMAALVRAAGGGAAAPVQAVTWAPTTPSRRRQRGFDQAELLARAVGHRLHLPVMGLLRRLPGPPQTGRTRAERRTLPAFTPGPRASPACVLLVDDVLTTGATLSAAGRALRSIGAEEVVALVAGRRA
ncbi:MAG TPA: phosphoribosyltransferase family protein [Acidimicrobiales bacterium]|nr:phosphoribosyltransferase family protein [Acidimicrobiales bacterium]